MPGSEKVIVADTWAFLTRGVAVRAPARPGRRGLARRLEEAFLRQIPESRLVTLAAWEARCW